jgi:TldD protein
MITENDCFRLLDIGLSKGGEFAEVFCESRKVNTIRMEGSRLRTLSSGSTTGVGIRVISGERVGYAFSDRTDRASLRETAVISASIGDGERRLVTRPLDRIKLSARPPIERPSGEVPSSEKIGFVRDAENAARAHDARIAGVRVDFTDVTKRMLVGNSEGVLVEESTSYTSFRTEALAVDDGRRHPGSSGRSGHFGWEVLEDGSARKFGEEAAEMAVRMLGAKEAPAGTMPVVIAKGNAVIIHEAIGHGLEADTVQKRRSIYGDKLGERVASPLVTIVDDPTPPYKGGSLRVDDECTPAQHTLLIDKGVLRGFLFDRIRARKAGSTSTGNGRRQSYQHYPIPRMTNTCLLGGEESPEDIVKETSRGLYVKRIGGGQVNTASGDFVFGVLEGWMIEDGELRYPVREASLIGNGIDVLRKVDKVGSDFEFDLRGGFCGKGQMVPVGFAQPTIRIEAMTVGGTKR